MSLRVSRRTYFSTTCLSIFSVLCAVLIGCMRPPVPPKQLVEGNVSADRPSRQTVAARVTERLATGEISAGVRNLLVNGKTFRAAVVDIPLGSVEIKVGLAQRRVGCTEQLADIARRYGAVAAINGCFFDAYSDRRIRNPHHTLLTDGELVHRGEVGSTVGFAPNRRPRIARLTVKIVGSLDGSEGWPDNWYAYWINRYPEGETTATIFTRHWAEPTTPGGGAQIVVRHGMVADVRRGPALIPADGFVLYLRGREEYMAERFRVGRRCSYRVSLQSETDADFWPEVSEALGCGPALVRAGHVTVNPEAEGFRHPKILTLACARSAVGVTSDGRLLLVTCGAATISELAELMRSLGCEAAMNLDGGASSGLWLRGKYLATPGRPISNALLVLERRRG